MKTKNEVEWKTCRLNKNLQIVWEPAGYINLQITGKQSADLQAYGNALGMKIFLHLADLQLFKMK